MNAMYRPKVKKPRLTRAHIHKSAMHPPVRANDDASGSSRTPWHRTSRKPGSVPDCLTFARELMGLPFKRLITAGLGVTRGSNPPGQLSTIRGLADSRVMDAGAHHLPTCRRAATSYESLEPHERKRPRPNHCMVRTTLVLIPQPARPSQLDPVD